MKATSKLYMVSSPADALFSAIVNDEGFHRDFVATNRLRMAQAYKTVTEWCRYHSINYIPTNAGHFILVNLERFLPTEMEGRTLTPEEREGALWAKVLENRVSITPGSNYRHPHTGTFRLTFTLGRAALVEGLSRLEAALELPHWSPPLEEQQVVLHTISDAPAEEEVKGIDVNTKRRDHHSWTSKSSIETAAVAHVNDGARSRDCSTDSALSAILASTEMLKSAC